LSESCRERVLRGIPRWLLRGYLEDLGGTISDAADAAPDEDLLAGAGWTARLTQLDDYRIGSLRSGQVRLTIRGEPAAVETLMSALEPRLFRGGG